MAGSMLHKKYNLPVIGLFSSPSREKEGYAKPA
jgi:hypothetical protein